MRAAARARRRARAAAAAAAAGYGGITCATGARDADRSGVAAGALTGLQDMLASEWDAPGFVWLPLATRALLAHALPLRRHEARAAAAGAGGGGGALHHRVRARAAAALLTRLSRSVFTSLDICLAALQGALPAAWAAKTTAFAQVSALAAALVAQRKP